MIILLHICVFGYSVPLFCFLAHKWLWRHCTVTFSWLTDRRHTHSRLKGGNELMRMMDRKRIPERYEYCQASSMHAPVLWQRWTNLSSCSTSEYECLLGKCLTLNKEQGTNCFLNDTWDSSYNLLHDVPISMCCYEWKYWSFVLLSHPGVYITLKNTTMNSILMTF